MIGGPDPRPQRVAEEICALYKLKRLDVHVDVLLACGSANGGEGHEVAACAQRLEDQATFNAWPLELVVLHGHHAARSARSAGLLTSAGFRLGGKDREVVIVRDASEVGEGPEWSVLGSLRRKTLKAKYSSIAGLPELLWQTVESRCTGHAWRPRDGEWERVRGAAPFDRFEDHVQGVGWLSPFRPIRFWEYCVLDVDLHNAIQDREHEATVRKLKKLFKTSLFFTSSASGGLHVYVRLPPKTRYADAVVWLAEYLMLHSLLIHKSSPRRFAADTGPVATRIVEVPLHPPRLPFGFGSELDGFPDPAKAVARFERWLKAEDFTDFTAARTHVETHRGSTRGRWPWRAEWVRTYVNDLELEALAVPKPKALTPTDPWLPYVPRLARNAATLVTHGCLAFGTRTAVMDRIADALVQLVEPDEARVLLRYWVEHREHNSEDIHIAKRRVLDHADDLVKKKFAGRGVPTAVWVAVEAEIRQKYSAGVVHHDGLAENECLRAAFYILRLFYGDGRARRRRWQPLASSRRPLSSEVFGRALEHKDVGGLPVRRPNRDRVKHVHAALLHVGLIVQVADPDFVEGLAREFELNDLYWRKVRWSERLQYQPT